MKNLGKGGGANFPTLEARRYKHGSPANVTNPLLPTGTEQYSKLSLSRATANDSCTSNGLNWVLGP